MAIDFETYRSRSSAGKRNGQSRCESCVYYDYDEEEDVYLCRMNLDEDEEWHFLQGQTGNCSYYRYYDEYKSAHQQN